MRFGYTILYVRDVAASVRFYERAFQQPARLVHESGQYAELETGPTTLAFAAHELASANLPNELAPGGRAGADGFEVCFVTEDVERAYARAVEAGAEVVSEPRVKPWGQRAAYVRDPDGNLVEIASPA
ncbi:MAG TPA: VOC family protein [Thermoleophilaceae bacterium]|nr:VOC family protein [Thermoleophilaceae bacterium]